jgi:hypothetical protein
MLPRSPIIHDPDFVIILRREYGRARTSDPEPNLDQEQQRVGQDDGDTFSDASTVVGPEDQEAERMEGEDEGRRGRGEVGGHMERGEGEGGRTGRATRDTAAWWVGK